MTELEAYKTGEITTPEIATRLMYERQLREANEKLTDRVYELEREIERLKKT